MPGRGARTPIGKLSGKARNIGRAEQDESAAMSHGRGCLAHSGRRYRRIVSQAYTTREYSDLTPADPHGV
jgi:hypothetical protein